jgi:hypothetical protein
MDAGQMFLLKRKCNFCDSIFSRSDARIRHEKCCQAKPYGVISKPLVEKPSTSTASAQPKTAASIESTTMLLEPSSSASSANTLDFGDNVSIKATSFRNRVCQYEIQNSDDVLLPRLFFEKIKETVVLILRYTLNQHHQVKFNFALSCIYLKPSKAQSDLPIGKEFIHSTKMTDLLQEFDMEDRILQHLSELNSKMDEFQERDSGWALFKINFLEVNVNKFIPLRGDCFTELPKFIKDKKAVINIANNDNRCFEYAVNASLHPSNRAYHQQIVSCYPPSTLNFGNIAFPMEICNIGKFELLNPTISINVFGVEDNKIVGPLYHTKAKKPHHVNLLYIQKGEKTHYCWIKNMSR